MTENTEPKEKFWMRRSKHGRDKIFSTPEILWDAACEYFQWVDENPLQEEKLFAFQGVTTKDTINKIRAMTIDGLCLFLGVGKTTWKDYKNREGYEDFSTVIEEIENVIRSQKFAGAAADLLNANIIARDLGLRDKSDIDHKSSDGSMSPVSPLTSEQEALLKKAQDGGY